MMMMIQVTCMLVLMIGSVFPLRYKKNLDAPNYLQLILASYKVPKETTQMDSQNQKIDDASNAGQGMPPQLESLLQLRRDIYHAYNLTYEVKDPMGRILNRNEYGDGSGTLRGSINFTKDNGKKAIINYSLNVEEHPDSVSDPDPEQIPEPKMRNSADEYKMTEESPIQKNPLQLITVVRAPQMLKSITMNKNRKLVQQERYLSPHSGRKFEEDYDDLQTLSSQLVENIELAPENRAFDDDMQGQAVVFQVKPKARGYEQVWKKGQGLVVDREYDLPNYEYRSPTMQSEEPENGENQTPQYVYHTKPAVRVFEVSRDTNGNYQIPEKYSNNIKQEGLENYGNYQGNQQQRPEDDGNYQIPEKYSGNIEQQGLKNYGSYQGNQQQKPEDDGNYQVIENFRTNQPRQEENGYYQVIENFNSKNNQQRLEDAGNYQILGNGKQQEYEEVGGGEPLFMSHSKPAIHVMHLNTDGGDSNQFGGGTQYPIEYGEIVSQDGSYYSLQH